VALLCWQREAVVVPLESREEAQEEEPVLWTISRAKSPKEGTETHHEEAEGQVGL
jgi:hypothetical protein